MRERRTKHTKGNIAVSTSPSPTGQPAPPVDISIIVATYNRKNLLLLCLKGLDEQQYDKTRYEVIVVDDASTDGTTEGVQALAKTTSMRLRYIRNPDNIGPGASRNRGLNEARGEIIAFSDDDFVPSNSWLSEISRSMQNRQIGGVSGRARSVGGHTLISRYCHFHKLHETPGMENGEVLYLLGANMATRRDVLDRIGGFDEDFVPAFKGITSGGEDTELSVRIRRAGYTLVFNEQAAGDHHQKNSLKSFFKETFNSGCSRVLWYQLEGRTISSKATCWRLLRRLLSVVTWPRHVLKLRREGVGWGDSLVFPIVEKASRVWYEIGVIAGILRQRQSAARQ